MKISLIIALLLGLLNGGRAAEFFVGKQGSDGNDGLTRERAFLTVQKGVNALQPGDTLIIGPGEYRENVRRGKLGDLEKDTIIRAELPGTVVLRGDVPLPKLRKLDGSQFVYVADFDFDGEVSAVNELDTLRVLTSQPNASEPDFVPRTFHYDRRARKIFISPSDSMPATSHRYSAGVLTTHGLYLSEPRRVIIEGLAVTGFSGLKEVSQKEETGGGVWGILLAQGKQCVVRDCHAWLNGWGIGVNSHQPTSGDNVIERCTAWANSSPFKTADVGGITILGARRDVIRDSTAFRNGAYGINIYGTGTDGGKYGDKNVPGNDDKNRSALRNNFAWGNADADFKIKTGTEYSHVTENCIGLGLWSLNDHGRSGHCLIGRWQEPRTKDNVKLEDERGLDVRSEFADPDNHDYRLQATSKFRNASPDGSDRGPFPHRQNVFYVAPNGDDSADGLSVAKAWKTLARGAKDLRPGDTLYVEPGAYAGMSALAVRGNEGAQIFIRGRGRGPVVLTDALRLDGAQHVRVERVHFSRGVTVAKGTGIAFESCQFTSDGFALEATDTVGLTLSHCAFTAFQKAAVTLLRCSGADLRGNIFDNRIGPAVRTDKADAVQYSNYNAYRRMDAAWELDGKSDALAKAHDAESSELTPEFLMRDGVVILQNPNVFAACGPMGKLAGSFRDEPLQERLALNHGPVVHSVSATTANIEWMTTLPASCKLAWGETPECRNKATFDVNCFGTYSVTGLKPGTTYHFRILSLQVPKEMADIIHALGAELEGRTVSFTTPKQNVAPTTYHVATDGEDSSTGLDRAHAWRTIRHAAERVNVGDTVLIAGGVYPERVRIRATGEVGEPITFKCAPGEKVILDGADKALHTAFVAAGKSHLRFDGMYFRDFNLFPHSEWRPLHNGEFHLYHCRDVQISRCFFDGRNGYTATTVAAFDVPDLTIQNCVNINKFLGMRLEQCPNLRIENCAFVRPMIFSFSLQNKAGQMAVMEKCIFTDMLKKKADLNTALFYTSAFDGLRIADNCIAVRSFPPEKRNLMSGGRGREQERIKDAALEASVILQPLFADPGFARAVALAKTAATPPEHPPELLTDPKLPLDFDSFFATNPDLIRRGIGLQPEAFGDFQFTTSRQ